MRLTQRGYAAVGILAVIGFLVINGIAGWIEGGM